MNRKSPPEKNSSTGILTLLETGDGETHAAPVAQKCIKISDAIYRCLDSGTCRHKFTYEAISLCAWPRPHDPERTPNTLPCDCAPDTDLSGGE